MYKVPIGWYNLSLICIGWISGPDFGALGMCSSHWKVVKGVMQPRTYENGPFGEQMFQALMVYFYHMHIWKVSGCGLFLNGTFGHGNMTCWPKCIVCVLEARISKTIIPQPREQKSGRRQTKYSNTQCGCLCNKSSWYCPMEPFQMRIFVVLVICVPTTLAKQILFLNHMNRKVVGGKHNIILDYEHISAPGLFGVVLCNCFK
ncbi:hypothetical protein FRACYDRAFT_244932 [Fragilariopsis cylindrus CCMP1102]|uniref:Uncharacterized protein n=1 Tax=Fragilariopsis cylindrus CCMP1102 TaxID=635003 RepID=A0A1E7F0Q3_9STRA|nr:hypothetical protein FRACYDRAFT_244932 [Fragilariopsis cylindrus CCMP1102]|eukprot:OEU11808.1 hypothetical protein FRACYDRAFT_244932 [Fragilariopsis cylindrus CCMP1102]